MNIVLYKADYRKTDVKKVLTGSVPNVIVSGTLRYPTNALNPIIRIDRSIFNPDTSLYPADVNGMFYPAFTANFVYVSELRRYYFIVNHTYISNTIIDIYLHVDVLHTYIGKTNAPLRTKSVFVERSSDSQIYNELYEDKRVSFMANNSISYLTLTNDDYDIELKDFSAGMTMVDLVSVPDLTDRNVIISMATKNITTNLALDLLARFTPVTNNSSNFDFRESGFLEGYITYVLTFAQANDFLAAALSNDPIASAIRNITVLPFSIPSSLLMRDNSTGTINYGNGQHMQLSTSISSQYPNFGNIDICANLISVKLFEGTLAADSVDSFIKSDINTKYELYIPYYGWTTIPSSILSLEPTMQIFYNINTDNGDMVYAIILDGELYETNRCFMGVNIAPTTSNAYENSKKEQALDLQRSISIVSGAIMAAAGIGMAAGGGAVPGMGLFAGGMSSIVGGVGNSIVQGLQIVDTYSKGTSTSSNGLFLYDEPIIKITRKELVQPLTGAWLNENGIPTKVNRTMSSLLGYTELGKCDFNIGSIDEEKELIELLMTGVHFPTTAGW